jgi:hypothetical protein
MTADEAIARWAALGQSGLVVSVACGLSRGRFAWSVDVLTHDGRAFEMPIEARSFAAAVAIAETETLRHGWRGAAS